MTELEFVNRASASLVKTDGKDDDVALAAWVSFSANEPERLNDREGVERLISFLMREEHNSPFEHSHFTFMIDCPFFVAREFHRHRTQAYNEVSGRYVELKPRFYVPPTSRPAVQRGKAGAYYFEPDVEIMAEAADNLREKNKWDWEHYERQLSLGVAKEVARMGLPLNMMTQFYATVSARNLIHFLGLRTSPQALYEIRQVAGDMELILAQTMPMTYAAWQQKKAYWEEFRQWKKDKHGK
jgi:thymidylate synthase (FAD)